MSSATTLLTSLVESEETLDSGIRVTRFNAGGEPAAKAIVNAVAANYHRLTGRDRVDDDTFEERIGEKVTLVLTGENIVGAPLIVAQEGTLFEGSSGVAVLPKGKRKHGLRVDASKVLDVIDGYQAELARYQVDKAREQLPTLRNLTRERLLELPGENAGDTCTLAVFGTHPLFDAPDCLWLIGEYWPDDDIVEKCVLLIRPEHGVSETGSIYGRELLAFPAGEVVGFHPIPFRDAAELAQLDYDVAFVRALARRL